MKREKCYCRKDFSCVKHLKKGVFAWQIRKIRFARQ